MKIKRAIENLIGKKSENAKNLLRKYFDVFKFSNGKDNIAESAKVIQKYFKAIAAINTRKTNMNKLKDMFGLALRKIVVKQIPPMFKELLKSNNKAAYFAEKIRKVVKKSPFKAILHRVRLILLKRITRKKFRKFKSQSNSYQFMFKRWAAMTVEKMNESARKIQSLFKSNNKKKQTLKSGKKVKFFNSKMKILSNHFHNKIESVFDKWNIKAKTAFYNQKATILQAWSRGRLARKFVRLLLLRKKLHSCSKSRLINYLKEIVLATEKLRNNSNYLLGQLLNRYTVNNMLCSYGRRKLENKLVDVLENLNEKREQSQLWKKLKYWQYFNKALKEKIQKIQNNVRKSQSKQKAKTLKLRDCLFNSLFARKDVSNKGHARQIESISLKRWLYKCIYQKVCECITKIQCASRIFLAKNRLKSIKSKLRLRKMLSDYMKNKILGRNVVLVDKINKFVSAIKRAFLRILLKKLNKHENLRRKLIRLAAQYEKGSESEKLINKSQYLKRWRAGTLSTLNKENEAATLINNAARRRKAHIVKHSLVAKREFINKKIVEIHDYHNEKLKYSLCRWSQLAVFQKMNESAVVIQGFLKSKRNELGKKSVGWFSKMGIRIVRHQVLRNLVWRKKMENNLNKLCPLIARKILPYFFKKIKNNGNYSELAKNIYQAIKKRLDEIQETFMRNLKIRATDVLRSQKTIAKQYKLFKQNEIRKGKISELIIKLYNFEDSKIRVFLQKWACINNSSKLNESSKIIQNFVKEGLDKRRNDKYLKLSQLFNKALIENNKIKLDLKSFIISYKQWLALGHIRKYIKIVFLKRLKRSDVNGNRRKAYEKLNALKLKKQSDVFRLIEEYIKEKAARMIQTYLRQGVYLKKEETKRIAINKLMIQKYNDIENLNKYYFSLWQKNAKLSTLHIASFIITRKIRRFAQSLMAKKKLHKLFRILTIRKLKDFCKYFEKSLNKDNILETACTKLESFIKSVEFRKLKKHANLRFQLANIIDQYDINLNIVLLRRFLKRWYEKLQKTNLIEKFQSVFLRLFRRTVKEKDLPCLSKLSTLRNSLVRPTEKLKKYIDLRFINKLRKFAALKTISKRLRESLENADYEIIHNITNRFLSNTFKTYAYKILSRLSGVGGQIDLSSKKAGMLALKRYHVNSITLSSVDSYNRKIKGKVIPKPLTFSFKSSQHAPRISNVYLLHSIPVFTKHFYSKLRERKQLAFKKIVLTSKKSKGLSLMLSIDSKKIRKSSSGFLEVFKSQHVKVKQTDKVRALVRKYLLDMLKQAHKEAGKLKRLIYLVKTTYMHNSIANKIYNKQLIQKWRFHCALKNTAKKKMVALYKNVNILYQTVAEDFFGDKPDSLKNNYANLSEKMGAFGNNKGDKPLVESALKANHATKPKRKYVFTNNYSQKKEQPEKDKSKNVTKPAAEALKNLDFSPYRKNNESFYSSKKKGGNDNSIFVEEEKSLNSSFNNSVVNLHELIKETEEVKKDDNEN